MYPGYIIPPLPKKIEKNLEPHTLQKNKHFLQRFLDDVLKHPILKTSSLLLLFLSISADKEFETKKKLYSKLPLPKEATDCRTIFGTASVSLTVPLQQYCSAVGVGVSNLKECFNKYAIYSRYSYLG